MLRSLGEHCRHWIGSFKKGKCSIDDEDRCERIVSMSDMILLDRLIGLKHISEVLNFHMIASCISIPFEHEKT